MTDKQNEQVTKPKRNGVGVFANRPSSLLRRLTEQLESVFQDAGMPRMRSPKKEALETVTFSPPIEIFQHGDRLLVRVDLPGLLPEDIRVDVTDEGIAIQGERRYVHEEEGDDVTRTERIYGTFYRLIPLPPGTNTDDTTALFDNGVLELSMKAASPKSHGRQVRVQASSKS